LNPLLIVGAVTAVTVKFAVLLTVPATGVSLVVTPEVVLGCMPPVLLVTLNVTVQLLFAARPTPLKLSAVAPAVNVLGEVPVQVPPTEPPAALMLTSVSENEALCNIDALLLAMVRVTTDVPPDGMLVGLKPLEMVGAATTVKFTVLLPDPATGVWVEVTPDVLLGWTPGVVLVTLNVTVQVVLPAMPIPLKLRAVAPAVRVFGVVPVQVPPTAPPAALILTSVSENDALLTDGELALLRVNVTRDVPPD
jgi:hypothetical protein